MTEKIQYWWITWTYVVRNSSFLWYFQTWMTLSINFLNITRKHVWIGSSLFKKFPLKIQYNKTFYFIENRKKSTLPSKETEKYLMFWKLSKEILNSQGVREILVLLSIAWPCGIHKYPNFKSATSQNTCLLQYMCVRVKKKNLLHNRTLAV